jgi:hypothetical protein
MRTTKKILRAKISFHSPGVMMLAASCGSSAVYFRLRNCSGLNQSPHTRLAEPVAMPPHAVLQPPGFESPLAAKATIVFGTFSLAGLGDTDRAKKHNRH